MSADVTSPSKREQGTLRQCPACHAPAVITSGVYGVWEDILFVLGASLYRCQNCELRYAHLRHWTISLRDPRNDDKTPYVVAIAIVGGLMACFAVALWTLRRAHRWPF